MQTVRQCAGSRKGISIAQNKQTNSPGRCAANDGKGKPQPYAAPVQQFQQLPRGKGRGCSCGALTQYRTR